MEAGVGRQSRLLGRLLGKLRGDHHKYNTLDKRFSITSSGMSESTGCGSTNDDEEMELGAGTVPPISSSAPIDDGQFAANIDLRYGGQYLTPEQLPEFCDQLHHLVEVIRNIQSYAKVTGEYPSKLERRLEEEAREVSALAAEARNAREVVARARTQRRAVRAQRKHLTAHLASLRETEVRELESTVRLSDRKLYKSWEVLKDSTDPVVFEPLLDEVKNKQTALECLVRLIESRQSALARTTAPPQPLPPPEPRDNEDTTATTGPY
ncbi:translation initiation factor IF-2, partial [Manduca sexta]|uniref:translation initiation factor IF-2 n=1 Tax=Manduca sexta TaxID=7130 RepID=UPI00188F92CD